MKLLNSSKILVLLILLNLSLFSACAESNNDINEEEPNIKIIKTYEDRFDIRIDNVNETMAVIFSEKPIKKDTIDFSGNMILDSSLITVNNLQNSTENLGSVDSTVYFTINGLIKNNDYHLALKNKENTIIQNKNISTLRTEPTEQASQIAVITNNENSITISWNKGDGEGRIVVISKDSIPQPPKDGIVYNASQTFGDQDSKYKDNNYVVFDSENSNKDEIKIKGLEFGNYYVQIFEYNGEGANRNYTDSSARMNPRTVQPTLPAPDLINAELTKSNTYLLKWKKLNDTVEYELQVASDTTFDKLLDPYSGIRVGSANQWEIPAGMLNNNDYYYRVRAIYGGSKSSYSDAKKVN